MKSAFSLVELIIVMGIFSILLGLGLFASITLRNSIELETSSTSLLQEIDSLANLARNSYSLDSNSNPDVWLMSSDVDRILIQYCYEIGQNLNCSLYAEKDVLQNILLIYEQGCAGIAYESLSNNIVGIEDLINKRIKSTGSCNIRLRHSVSGMEKLIKIDLEKNNISL